MHLAVVGNCQVHGLAGSLRLLAPNAHIEAHELIVLKRKDALGDFYARLSKFDLVIAHPIRPGYDPISDVSVRDKARQMIPVPLITFSGFHPDAIYIYHAGRELASPVGPYHSALTAASFLLGLSTSQTLRLFNSYVFQRFGYFAEFHIAHATLIENGHNVGLDLKPLLDRWLSDPVPFMHTSNHPKIFALASIARIVAEKAGLIPPGSGDRIPETDYLFNFTVWPVYPEIARRAGVQGSLEFKRSQSLVVAGQSATLDLDQFVSESFSIYNHVPEGGLRSPYLTEYAQKLRELLCSSTSPTMPSV